MNLSKNNVFSRIADAVKKESQSKASADGKLAASSKERTTVKRTQSSSPAPKVNKNKRNDIQDLDVLKFQGSNSNSKKGDIHTDTYNKLW